VFRAGSEEIEELVKRPNAERDNISRLMKITDIIRA